MKNVIRIKWACLAVAVLVLAISFVIYRGWWPLALILVLTVPWLLLHNFQKRWLLDLSFLLAFIVLAVGFWLEIHPGLLVLSAVGFLAAWDLTYFEWRLKKADLIINQNDLVKRHLFRLGLVCFLGALSAALSQFVSLNLAFGVVILLSFITVITFVQVLRFGRRWVES